MLTGRHRAEHPALRSLRHIAVALADHWPIAVLAVLAVVALIAGAATDASANPAPTPPQVGVITSGAAAGVTAGAS